MAAISRSSCSRPSAFLPRRGSYLHFTGEFAQFTFESQRSAAGFFSAADGISLIADAVGQQEKSLGILDGQLLGGGTVLGEIATRQAGKQVSGALLNPLVKRRWSLSRPATPSALPAVAAPRLLAHFRMNQKCRAAVHIGAHDVDAALGFIPILHHHVFQLFMEELFGGFFERGLHFNEIRQHARRAELFSLALFDGGEEALHAFGGIGAMRKNFFERILAGFEREASVRS